MSELGREARAFLATARGAHDAPPDAKDRVRQGLAAALSAPAVTGVAALSAGAAVRARWLMVAKVATAAGIVAAGAGAILLAYSPLWTSRDRPRPAVSAPVGVLEETPPLPPVVIVAPPTPTPTPTRTPTPTSTSTSTSTSTHAPSEQSVAAEVAILRRVSAALRAADPKSALTAVAEHARRFPNGALAEERDTERIVALCALGRREEAARATSMFERSYPTSSHEARVRAACAAPPARPLLPSPLPRDQGDVAP